jgi:phosphoglycolate phosphatase
MRTTSPRSSTPTGTGSHNDTFPAPITGHASGARSSNGSRAPTSSARQPRRRAPARRGVAVPEAVASATDPFDVLRFAASISCELAEAVEAQLRANEIEAARTARATPCATEVVGAWRNEGRLAAIVSNNSAAAVETYLSNHDLRVDHIAARTSADPALLKPSPHLITDAIRALDADAAASALVGDSATDMPAARLAGVATVADANKPGKHTALAQAGAGVVIDDMQALMHAVAIVSA